MRPSPYTTHETIPLSQTVRVEDVRQKPDFWGGIWVVVLELQKQSEHTYLQTTIQTLPPSYGVLSGLSNQHGDVSNTLQFSSQRVSELTQLRLQEKGDDVVSIGDLRRIAGGTLHPSA